APIVQWPRTPPFQGGNTGSNPVGGAQGIRALPWPSLLRLVRFQRVHDRSSTAWQREIEPLREAPQRVVGEGIGTGQELAFVVQAQERAEVRRIRASKGNVGNQLFGVGGEPED